MNKIAALVALAGIASVATLAHGQTYSFTGTPIAIPDGTGPAGITISTDPVAAVGTIQSVTCTITMNPGHTFTSDLDIILTFTPADGSAPVSAFLASENGGANNMVGTYTFSDTATANFGTGAIAGVLPPGTYRAMNAAAQVSLNGAFAGLPAAGTWSIDAADFFDFDSGTIESASVSVVLAGVSVPPSGTAPAVTLSRGGPGTTAPYSALVTANITPGLSPVSAISFVQADLSSVGLSSTANLVDDGSNGDAAAGDGIYSLSITPDAGVAAGVYTIPFVVRDEALRTASFSGTLDIRDVTIANFGTLAFDGSTAALSSEATAGNPAWFKFTSTSDASDPGSYLDMTVTANSGFADTYMAIYSADGTFLRSDDDDGAGVFSQLSFGRVSPARPAVGGGTAPAGQDGALSAGEYYVAVVQFFSGFGSPFTFTNAATGATTATVEITASQQAALAVATTTAVINRGGPASVPGPVYALVTGRISPATPGYVLTADFSSMGGGSAVAMVDDGTNGDEIAGDGVFTGRYDVATIDAGVYPVTVNTTGTGTLTASVNVRVNTIVTTDLGTLAFTGAGVIHDNVITAREVNWLRFEIAQNVDAGGTLYLDIDTNGSTMDTHLGLFSADGTFLAISDDDDGDGLESALSFGSTDPTGRDTNPTGAANNGRDGGLASGVYYLALNFFPATYGTPFVATNTSAGVGGSYTVHLFPGSAGVAPVTCLSDINADGTPADGGDFILFINSFGIGDASVDPLADVAGGGDPNRPEGGPDGNIDGTDFIAFINAFAAGC